jgi:(2Fe-2S) ferredoxin
MCVGPNCAARGAEALFTAVWTAFERERLAYYTTGGNLRLTKCGCLGACQSGPIMLCTSPNTEAWYWAMDYPHSMAVARAAHAGEPWPTDRQFNDQPNNKP